MKNRVERAALEVLLKHNIRSLPIKLVPIANNYGIRVNHIKDKNFSLGNEQKPLASVES